MEKKIDIPAIHDKDLKKVLENLGILDKLENEELFCANCGNQITWENLFALKVIDGSKLVLFCDETDCINLIN
jgi:hypothetical protein